MHDMNSPQDDPEVIATELAPLLSMGLAQEKGVTGAEKARREWLAEWLVRTHSPQELAMLALAASETAQGLLGQINPLLKGIDAQTDYHELLNAISKAEHTLQRKTAVWEAKKEARRETARKGAAAKLERSPKQAAKSQAFKLWEDWQANKLRFRSGAAFALYVVKELPELTSPKVVEGWVTEWRRAAIPK